MLKYVYNFELTKFKAKINNDTTNIKKKKMLP